MLKRLQTSWTCSRCLRRLAEQQQQHTTRRYSVAAAASHVAPPNLDKQHLLRNIPTVVQRGSQVEKDNATLRQIFDHYESWRAFTAEGTGWQQPPTGLLQNRYLTAADGFGSFADATLRKCRKLVDRIKNASSIEDYQDVVQNMDRLSDMLCRVIDIAEFVRNTHPDRSVQAAATEAHAKMFEYMNVLNTTTELNAQLVRAMDTPEVYSGWTEEERVVAEQLKRDFGKSAIDLPTKSRQRFVELSNEISQLGAEFMDNIAPKTTHLQLNKAKLRGMNQGAVQRLTRWGTTSLPTVGSTAMSALETVEDPDTRREIYVAQRTASKGTIDTLEHLLMSRAELAQVSGYDSFSRLALMDKMAQTPEAVDKFLTALVEDNRPRVQEELAELLALKQADAVAGNFPKNINAWDRLYYVSKSINSLRAQVATDRTLSNYFSLGTVMSGISQILHRLYGIRLVPRPAAPGEVWHEDVRRLDVVDDVLGHVAVLYCDLFKRPWKSPNPSHFTLRCSRIIAPTEISEAAADLSSTEFLSDDFRFDNAEEAASDGMAAARDPRDGKLHQLPTIALICDFAHPYHSSSGGAQRSYHPTTLLTFREVQTLFHEMGHAAHSILGRTALQNVSGTRCATDLSELPSILFERFASSFAALPLFARHWQTNAPLPPQLLSEAIRLERAFGAAENEAQTLMALLDQRCHALQGGVGRTRVDSTRLYHDVWNEYASVPEPAGTSWQGFFGHMVGYGATYYAYLFDRAIAGKVWREVFVKDGKDGKNAWARAGEDEVIDWAAGERFREEVLKWGGSRDGWKCVAGIVGDETVAEGGEAAMAEVGKWGIGMDV